VVAAGKWLGRFLPQSENVKVVASPLLIVYPAVTDHNFVRMTPFVEKSLNHLHHEIDGRVYSVIGGGYWADPDDPAAVERATTKLIEMARRVFPRFAEADIVETYQGYKTEIVAKSGERNYQYFIRDVGDGVHIVVPGKFSLGFSLAVNTYQRIVGRPARGSVQLASVEAARPYVGVARHAAMVREGLGKVGGHDTDSPRIQQAMDR
jgi:hypothetical protein